MVNDNSVTIKIVLHADTVVANNLWKDSKMNGHGTMTYPVGRKEPDQWGNGEFICK